MCKQHISYGFKYHMFRVHPQWKMPDEYMSIYIIIFPIRIIMRNFRSLNYMFQKSNWCLFQNISSPETNTSFNVCITMYFIYESTDKIQNSHLFPFHLYIVNKIINGRPSPNTRWTQLMPLILYFMSQKKSVFLFYTTEKECVPILSQKKSAFPFYATKKGCVPILSDRRRVRSHCMWQKRVAFPFYTTEEGCVPILCDRRRVRSLFIRQKKGAFVVVSSWWRIRGMMGCLPCHPPSCPTRLGYAK